MIYAKITFSNTRNICVSNLTKTATHKERRTDQYLNLEHRIPFLPLENI